MSDTQQTVGIAVIIFSFIMAYWNADSKQSKVIYWAASALFVGMVIF